jgi:hypothetical protein
LLLAVTVTPPPSVWCGIALRRVPALSPLRETAFCNVYAPFSDHRLPVRLAPASTPRCRLLPTRTMRANSSRAAMFRKDRCRINGNFGQFS